MPLQVALLGLATLATSGAAQDDGPSRQGRVREKQDAAATVRTEQELTISIEVPALPSAQCEATVSTDYHQRNTVVRVASTIEVEGCAAAAGEFTLAVRVKGDDGPREPLEFKQPWQRTDAADVTLSADYPIGENVELVSVRTRDLRCTCADPPQPAE